MADDFLTENDILDVLNERSEADNERECVEEEDNVEWNDEHSDDYDSDADPEYIPDEEDITEIENDNLETIREIEFPQEVRQPATTSSKKRPGRQRKQLPPLGNRPSEDYIDNDELVITMDTEDGIVVTENGFLWGSECDTSVGKTPAKNIVHIRPGPIPPAREKYIPSECFKLFFNANLVEQVLQHTNEEIQKQKRNYNVDNTDATVGNLCLEELHALFGLIILAAALKDNHLSSNIMFDNTYCGERYKATMSERRFKFLINCLRFDDKATRDERKKTDKLAPIRHIWQILLENCRSLYKPGSYLAIDEQLVGFRGRCPFRMYMPSKPNKYGIKIIMMCDNSTKYMVDARLYMGKGSVPTNRSAAEFFVEELVISIENTNRNITMDNWFTSVPLVQKLFIEKGLTVVGTIKRNKPEFPSEFTDKKYKKRKVGTSLFLFRDGMTAVSYKPNDKKVVTLISSMHDDNAINENGKPEIVMVYNTTKGAVDTFDQMCGHMNCNRKTQRWPLCIFYNMMNIALINSYVVFAHNTLRRSGGTAKPISRQQFMLELHKELTKPWQEIRMTQRNMNRALKQSIQRVLMGQRNMPAESAQPNQQGPRKYCSFCDVKKKRMTTTYCACGNAICGEHQKKLCPDCG